MHSSEEMANTIKAAHNSKPEIILVFGASAIVDRSDVTSGLVLGLKNHWRMSVGEDRSDTSLNRFELPNGLKIALISDLTTMLGEPKEKKRAWNTLRSRPEIGQKVFN